MAQETVATTNMKMQTITDSMMRNNEPLQGAVLCSSAGAEYGIYLINGQSVYNLMVEAKFTQGAGRMLTYLFEG